MTLNYHNRPSWEVRTFIFFVREIRTRHKVYHFPSSDIEFAQMTLGQNHDKPLGHKQSLCEVRTGHVWTERQTDRQTRGRTSVRLPAFKLFTF